MEVFVNFLFKLTLILLNLSKHRNSHTKFLNLNVPPKLLEVPHTICLFLLDYSDSLIPFYSSSPFCPLGVAVVASNFVALSVTYLLNNAIDAA